jgi:predicted unusual protein kinase regulating ubiquinone biosynthesis (AarF/ABC1/UbiB family)
VFWGERRRRRRERVVLHTAEDVRRTMGEMKGAVMKVGQVLSLMTGVVPDEVAKQLASLQSDAPPMDYRLVEEVFLAEYGEPPRGVFKQFEKEPFAAASIGQVHRATLHDGRRVAVKVQYPGVREAIAADLANAGMLIGLAARMSRGLEAGPIVEDLKAGISGELDYVAEARWQTHFADLYRGHAFVKVPEVVEELCRERVLVQELVRGRPFAEAYALPPAERYRVAESVFRYAFGNFYRHGLFNGDPHPGNYLLLGDGRIAFVDYGCVARFPQNVVDQFRALIMALYDGDLPRWRVECERIGILREGAPFSTDELYEHMHWFWKPVLEPEVTFTPELAAEMVRRNAQATGPGGAINRQLNIPPGMVFLSRINFGLAGLLGGLEVRGPWRSIIAEYLYGGPSSTELGRASAATTLKGPPI